MCKNKLIVAAAGSGKTTLLVYKALTQKKDRVLITTYTLANEAEIRKKFIEVNKCIPENITVQTWFSFLLQHGVRPYQGCLFDKNISGMILVNSPSALYIPEINIAKHYFDNKNKIYSDKISKFFLKCNTVTNGNVIDRLSRIYPNIFIDEVQDLAGFDLELLKLLFKCNSNILLVGDPRQGTYSTNYSPKNRKFQKSGIINFFLDDSLGLEIDFNSLTKNYRSISSICDFSNKLFPELEVTNSGNEETTEHGGIFFIRKSDVGQYLKNYNPMQLRESRRESVDNEYPVMNFGESKGMTFERVLIYPTQTIIKWIFNNEFDLAPTSRSKFYVAVTRARNSVGIVYNYNKETEIEGIKNYIT